MAGVLQSFLQQILQEADPEKLSLLERHRARSNSPTLKDLSKTLLDLVRIKPTTYLNVDVLDGFDDRKAPIAIPRELAEAGIKVFVTSRDVPDIRDLFERRGTSSSNHLVLI
jgi:hypothetical protein